MYYDEDFIKSLPGDSHAAIAKIGKHYHQQCNMYPEGDVTSRYEVVRKTAAFLSAYLESQGITEHCPEMTGEADHDTKAFDAFFSELLESVHQRLNLDSFDNERQQYLAMLGAQFFYEFSKGDLDRIQKLLNQIRELISASEELEEDHRNRLLRKLEKLQSELHKKVSDLDRFWGFIMDLGLAIGQMAENAKPVAELASKVISIIYPEQARAVGLPSNLEPKLPGPTEDE